MGKKSITLHRNSHNENTMPITENAHTQRLSSTCIENEQANVRQYMNYENAFFSFSRMKSGSIPNRFYPTLYEAYKTTLEHCKSMKNVKSSKNNIFCISDCTQKVLYEGNITPAGKIIFSIYNGKKEKTVSTIDCELNKLTTNKNFINMAKRNITESVVGHNDFENNDMAVTISSKAKVYLENKILTPDSVKFLCLSETCAQSVAESVQKTAIANKNVSNQDFTDAIAKASHNMILITKALASGKATDSNHVSFHDDLLYCASHCKSKESLFNGMNTWKKVPGKIAYNKICSSIMEMYHMGQKMLIETATADKMVKSASVQDNTAAKKTLNEVVRSITATVMTFLRSSADMRYYLNIKNITLDSELNTMSNGIMSGTINDDIITLKMQFGLSRQLILSDYQTDELLREAIRTNVSQLFVGASIFEKTRDMITALVDLSSIEKYYIDSQTNPQKPVNGAPVEKNNTEDTKDNSDKIDRYNNLVAEKLYDVVDSESNAGTREKQLSVCAFLKTCAMTAGLPEGTDISIMIDWLSDPFNKDLVMDILNNLAQPQYSQAA